MVATSKSLMSKVSELNVLTGLPVEKEKKKLMSCIKIF